MQRRLHRQIHPILRPRREFVVSVDLERMFDAYQSFTQSTRAATITRGSLALVVNRS